MHFYCFQHHLQHLKYHLNRNEHEMELRNYQNGGKKMSKMALHLPNVPSIDWSGISLLVKETACAIFNLISSK